MAEWMPPQMKISSALVAIAECSVPGIGGLGLGNSTTLTHGLGFRVSGFGFGV